jgi:hypothetical protein
VRSMRSIRSDGASTHGETEIILGPSPDHPLIKGEPSVIHHHPFLLPASGPSAPAGSFPTPLSPPRRPARSPIPPPPPPRGGPLHHGDSRPSTPSSGSAYSDMGDSGQSAAPTLRPSDVRTDPAETAVWRADTAAWLSRKPSGRRPAPLASVVDGRRRAESASSQITPSVSGTSASGESVDEPLTPTVSPRLGGIPATPTSAQHQRHPMSAMASPSPRRPSPPPSQPSVAPAPAAPRTPDRSGYVVSVQCLPAADGEVRWEVVLRRSPSGLEAEGLIAAPAPGGPVLLAPGTDGAQSVHAPPFASSVNLSLALDTDAPTGKLQFITLPGATPTRVRPRSTSHSGAPSSPRHRAPQSPTHPMIPRDSVFGPSILGPPAPLSPQQPRHQHSPPPDTQRLPQEPLSPRSSAYKRQGAVWAASGGFSPLSGEDVFTSNPHMPSPRAARQAAAGRAALARDGSPPERVNVAEHAARPSLDGLVGRVQLA